MTSNIIPVSAAATIKNASGATIPSEYGTSFDVGAFSSISYSSQFVNNTAGNENVSSDSYAKMIPHNILTNSSNFGKIWWQYNNAATYNGTKVHIKFTAVSWDNSFRTPTGSDITEGSARYYLFARSSKYLGGFYPINTRIKVEFFNASTGQPISMKGNMTLIDMDGYGSSVLGSESFTLHNGVDYVYIGENLRSDGQKVYSVKEGSTNDTDKDVMATLCFNGTSFEFTYDIGAFSGFYNGSLAPFEVPAPTKSVNTTSTTIGGAVNYTIKQFVPNEDSDYYYTSFSITDTLPSVLTWTTSNVTIKNSDGTNVTSLFNITKSGNTLTCSLKSPSSSSFYGTEYTITVNTTVNSSGLGSYTSSSGTVISNSAKVTTNRGTKTSNTVNTNITYKIDTSISHGTITQSSTGISGGSNRNVTFTPDAGYWVSSVVIDGKEITGSELESYMKGGTVSFENIQANHTVDVICSPCYKITTSVVNGQISEQINNIYPGENKTVNFEPNDDYYIAEIYIDGQLFTPSQYDTIRSQSFGNIQKDHDIRVVCKPLHKITTRIENGRITDTITGIHPDERKEILWEPYEDYWIESVTIDGVPVAVVDFLSGEWDFIPNGDEDHEIVVVCQPKYVISTEVVNGSITPSEKLYPNEDFTPSYQPNPGYHLKSITVDGEEIKDIESFLEEYPFTRVNKNHNILVEYEQNPVLSLEKETELPQYNVKDDILYTLTLKQTVEGITAQNVILTDTDIPDGIVLDMDSLLISGIEPEMCHVENSENGFIVTFDKVAYSDVIQISFKAKVESELLLDKTVTNKATADCDYLDNIAKAEATVDIIRPELSIKKDVNKSYVNTIDDLRYTITVEETKQYGIARNIVIEDELKVSGAKISNIQIQSPSPYTIEKTSTSFVIHIDELQYQQQVIITYDVNVSNHKLSGKEVNNIASVQANYTDKKTDNVTVPVLQPDLDIIKVADADKYNYDDDVVYQVIINQVVEHAIAYNVSIFDDMPDGVQINMNSFVIENYNSNEYEIIGQGDDFKIIVKEMPYNKPLIITYTGHVSDSKLVGQNITNTIHVNTDNNPNEEIYQTDTTQPVLKPQLDLSKTADKNVYNVKDVIHYTVVAQQTVKDAIAVNTIFSDKDMTEGITIIPNSLKVSGLEETNYQIIEEADGIKIRVLRFKDSDVMTVTFDAIVESNDLVGLDIYNKALIAATNAKEVTSTATSTVAAPQLIIKKYTDKKDVNTQDIITYTVDALQNDKNARANNVVISDTMTKGMKLLKDSFVIEGINSERYNLIINDESFILAIDELSYGENIHIEYKAQVINHALAGQNVENYISIHADNETRGSQAKTVNNVMKPQLAIKKSTDEKAYNTGDVMGYHIDVTQTVEDAIAHQVVMTDKLPEGVVFVEDSLSVNGVDSWDYMFIDGILTVTTPKLAYDEHMTVHFNVTVEHSMIGQTIKNIAEAICSNNPEAVQDEVETFIYAPRLALDKSVDKTTAHAGETLNFTVTVRQLEENAIARSVVVTDILSDNMTLLPGSIQINGMDYESLMTSDHTFTLTLGDMAYGQEAIITYQAVAHTDLVNDDILHNVATVESFNTHTLSAETNTTVQNPVIVKTGDTTIYVGYVCGLISSSLVLIYLRRKQFAK